jgi:hypothetical protein
MDWLLLIFIIVLLIVLVWIFGKVGKLRTWAGATSTWLHALKEWIDAGMPGGTDPGDPPGWDE